MRRAAEMKAAALERKQQEQQAKQQQQHILKMNKKKVQNAIKTQQRKSVTPKSVSQTSRPLSFIKPNPGLKTPLLPVPGIPARFRPQVPAQVGVVRTQPRPNIPYKAGTTTVQLHPSVGPGKEQRPIQ